MERRLGRSFPPASVHRRVGEGSREAIHSHLLVAGPSSSQTTVGLVTAPLELMFYPWKTYHKNVMGKERHFKDP